MIAAVNPSALDFADAAEALGLPSPDLVEKDYWVVRVLSVIHALSDETRCFVFGGGTSLCRAYCLIDRMSEDIDMRVVSAAELTHPERRRVCEQVQAALVSMGLSADTIERKASDVHRKVEFKVAYDRATPDSGILRPEIKLELAFYPLSLATQNLAIRSFLHQASGQSAELESMPCVALEETAAEKFIALLRRVGAWQRQPDNAPFDQTLIRHMHDLERITGNVNRQQMLTQIRALLPAEIGRYARSYPEFAENPWAEMARVIQHLRQEEYAMHFDRFQQSMVYRNSQRYVDCLQQIDSIYQDLIHPS